MRLVATLLVVTLASVAWLSSCALPGSRPPLPPPAPLPADPPLPAESSPSSMDAEILGLLAAVDEHQVRMADEAQARSEQPAVQEFAEQLGRDHGLDLERSRDVARDLGVTPAESAEVQALRSRGESELARLLELEGEAFDSAFLAALVQDHEELLEVIDVRLLPGASSPAVKEHLESARSHIARHLDDARRLQSDESGRS